MIEVKMTKEEIAPKKKRRQDGFHDSITVVLTGEDESNGVELRLTIKCDDETKLPKSYRDIVGEHEFDEVILTLEGGTQQSKL